MPLIVGVRRPEPRPRNCVPIPFAPQRCECSWLEGLRMVLDRVIDSHEQRGAPCPYLPRMHLACPKGSGSAGTLESQQAVIEHITKETAVLSDCVCKYEEKGRLGQVWHFVLCGARGWRCIQLWQIVGANDFAKESNEVIEKLRRLVDLMQVGLQVPAALVRRNSVRMRNVLHNRCSSRPSSRTTRF